MAMGIRHGFISEPDKPKRRRQQGGCCVVVFIFLPDVKCFGAAAQEWQIEANVGAYAAFAELDDQLALSVFLKSFSYFCLIEYDGSKQKMRSLFD